MRLGREVPGKAGLQRQAQCYLAALNALRLVKPEYTWIIKPMIPTRLDVSTPETINNLLYEVSVTLHRVATMLLNFPEGCVIARKKKHIFF